jgi:hypothetical protein
MFLIRHLIWELYFTTVPASEHSVGKNA